MGRKRVQLTVTAYLSNHNSEQDAKDADAWDRYIALVKSSAQLSVFADIDIDVSES